MYFSCQQIKQGVQLLKPLKAPGPDGIPNLILIESINILINHLFYIYRAVFDLDIYHVVTLDTTIG